MEEEKPGVNFVLFKCYEKVRDSTNSVKSKSANKQKLNKFLTGFKALCDGE